MNLIKRKRILIEGYNFVTFDYKYVNQKRLDVLKMSLRHAFGKDYDEKHLNNHNFFIVECECEAGYFSPDYANETRIAHYQELLRRKISYDALLNLFK